TAAAASSDETPEAISFQNSRSMLRLLDGAPGEIIGFLPVRSLNHPAGRPMTTLSVRVLRRPVESALCPFVAVVNDSTYFVLAAPSFPHRMLQSIQCKIGAQSCINTPPDNRP